MKLPKLKSVEKHSQWYLAIFVSVIWVSFYIPIIKNPKKGKLAVLLFHAFKCEFSHPFVSCSGNIEYMLIVKSRSV